jgi:hypothetical protein
MRCARWRYLILCLSCFALSSLRAAEAPTPGRDKAGSAISIELRWWTLDGGGGPLQSGLRRLDASLGQPDANPGPALRAGARELRPGYWTPRNDTVPPSLFADGFETD